jgi:hypothetical protein
MITQFSKVFINSILLMRMSGLQRKYEHMKETTYSWVGEGSWESYWWRYGHSLSNPINSFVSFSAIDSWNFITVWEVVLTLNSKEYIDFCVILLKNYQVVKKWKLHLFSQTHKSHRLICWIWFCKFLTQWISWSLSEVPCLILFWIFHSWLRI